MMLGRRLSLLLWLLACLILTPAALAHPMGNFSVNHYSKIIFESDGIRIRYIIDLAEIPTYQELQQRNIKADASDPGVARFLADRGEALRHGLSLTIDGKPLPLRLLSKEVIFPPGAGGLPTMKMGFVYQAAYSAGTDQPTSSLQYFDHNFEGHSGWKEIVVHAPTGSLIRSSAPQTDRSAELTNYPTELLNSPPQDLEASLQFRYPVAAETARMPLSTALQGPSAAPGAGMRAAHSHGLSRRTIPHHPSDAAGMPARAAASREERRPEAATTPTAEPLHLQPNRQTTPRNAFTELIAADYLSVVFLFSAALIALGIL